MNKRLMFSLLIVIVAMFAICVDGYAEKPSLSIDSISIGSRVTAIDGDNGRYREDNFITDDYTGGIEELIMSGNIADASLGIDMHALFDYDYGLKLDLDKEDAYFLNVDTRQMRRYYDGSNEPFDTIPYALGSQFNEREDGHMYIDRLDSTVEVGLLFDSLPNFTFGWERYDRDGEETLARGSRARENNIAVDFRGIPAWRQVDGWSDTFSIKFDQQFADKHNVAIKQEYETYRDEQRIIYPRYNNGTVQEFRVFEDEPAFNEALSHASYNSFLNDKTYLTANYLYQNLKNTTRRQHLRTNYTVRDSINRFINPEVNNRRDAHIVNVGLVLLDGLVKDLRIGANTRFEKAITKNEGQGVREQRTTRLSESEQDSVEYNESISISYSGIKRTNLSFIVEGEQRKLNWWEWADVNDHELVTDFGFLGVVPSGILSRETEIRHNDLIMTLQGTHRIDNKNKVTAKYKRENKRRKYANVGGQDIAPTYYPGYLGSSDQKADKILLRYDTSVVDNWMAGFEYGFEYDVLGYASQNGVDGQQIKRNRLSANVTGTVTDKMTLNVNAMGERYDFDTPADGNALAKFESGDDAYNYEVEMYLGGVSSNYRFNDKTSSTLAYQHTEVTGTIRNGQDEVSIALNHDLDDDSNLETRLEWFNFNNKIDGGADGFDDYTGVVAEVIYNRDF